ncbi:MAG: hypothetical protein WCX17_03740 [Parcubacteria group bacterium]
MKKIYLAVIAIIIAGTAAWMAVQFSKTKIPAENKKTADIETPSSQERACLDSGGTVTAASCCQSTQDFPDNCAIGACGCAPEYSQEVKFCGCGKDKCFNGKKCTAREEAEKSSVAGSELSSENYVNSSLKLVAYNGQIYSAKIPEGWRVDESISGINIANPEDSNMGVALIAVSGWPGKSSPDAFIEKIAGMGGLTDIKYISESKEGTITNPSAPGYIWKEKTKIFTCKKDATSLKIKADAGVINGQGQYVAVFKGFQTTPDKWDKWAPLLERVALSATITNPSKVGGADMVKLPTAADLANDSSPLMEAWEYRNNVQDRASHNFSDAIMGVESDLVSPATGQSYTLPLSAYDPTKDGYHNPDNYSEILIDSYE